MLIDCDTCVVRGKGCQDCVINVLLAMPGPVELDDAEQNALDALAEAGLVPPLRLVPRYSAGSAAPAAPRSEAAGKALKRTSRGIA